MNEPAYLQCRDFHKALNADVVKKSKGNVPWLKDHCGQFEDPEYRMLTLAERGLLKDIRILAARRGNKILNDERYIRGQLGISAGTQLSRKLKRLRELRFLEPWIADSKYPANLVVGSRTTLERSESQVRAEVKQQQNKDKTSLPVSASRSEEEVIEEAAAGLDPERVEEAVMKLRGFDSRSWQALLPLLAELPKVQIAAAVEMVKERRGVKNEVGLLNTLLHSKIEEQRERRREEIKAELERRAERSPLEKLAEMALALPLPDRRAFLETEMAARGINGSDRERLLEEVA